MGAAATGESAGVVLGIEIDGEGASDLTTVSEAEGAGCAVELQPGFAKMRTKANTWMPTTMPKTFESNAITVPIGISIGIATTETGDITPDEILRQADTAMYLAKTKGKGCYRIADAAA